MLKISDEWKALLMRNFVWQIKEQSKLAYWNSNKCKSNVPTEYEIYEDYYKYIIKTI